MLCVTPSSRKSFVPTKGIIADRTPRFKILIDDRQRKIRLSKTKIRAWSVKILKLLGLKNLSVSVLLVDDKEMSRLHQKFLGIKGPTDVLAFGQERPFLGDVVISVETARKRAPEFGNRWDKELLLYLIHGMLHLLGLRDTPAKEKKKMRAKEQEILNQLLGPSWPFKKQKLLF